MAFHKVCAYEPCSKPFTCPGSGQRFCSVACGNKARTLATQEQVKAYFLANVRIPDDPTLCWEWIGSLTDSGYGMAFVRNSKIRAHRLAHELYKYPIPDDLDALHSELCTTRACVNPDHIRAGTNFENMQDRKEFGDQIRGSRHHMAKESGMTETRVLHILRLFHKDGITMTDIAKRYRLSLVAVHDIIHRKTWQHVAPETYPAPTDQRAIVNPDIVREMRRLRETEQWDYQRLVEKYQLKYPTVVDICTYRTWRKVR